MKFRGWLRARAVRGSDPDYDRVVSPCLLHLARPAILRREADPARESLLPRAIVLSLLGFLGSCASPSLLDHCYSFQMRPCSFSHPAHSLIHVRPVSECSSSCSACRQTQRTPALCMSQHLTPQPPRSGPSGLARPERQGICGPWAVWPCRPAISCPVGHLD